MKTVWTVFVVAILAVEVCCGQLSSRRDDVINDWIRRIREAPKGHSMSPSWSSKSRIPVIGVGELPLQNEAEVSAGRVGAASSFQSQDRQQFSRPTGPRQPSFSPRPSSPDFSSKVSRPEFSSRPGPISDPTFSSPPRRESPQQGGFDQFGPPRNRASENSRPGVVPPFSFEDIGSEFPKFDDQFERPKRNNQGFPGLSSVFPEVASHKEDDDDFSKGFFGSSQPQAIRTEQNQNTQNQNPTEYEEEEDGDFEVQEVEVRPVRQQEHKKGPILGNRGPQPFRPQFFRQKQKQPQLFRPKHKRFSGGIQRPFPNNGPSAPRHRSSQGPQRSAQEYPNEREVSIPRQDEVATPVIRRPPPQTPTVRTTTERPIPTPGPEDFPPMPPPRPTVPTVPPTHPPPITHPPSHYLPASYLPSNNLESANYDEDYDVQEKGDEGEKEDPGFFELPPGFPSLESLGSGFESMKIRNKRSAGDLDVGEQRIRRRQFANNPYSQQQPGRHRRQHSGNSNNDYSFQQNFWDDVDIDTRDFFNPQTAAPQVQQQQQQQGYGQRSRPFKAGNYQSYTQQPIQPVQPNRYLQQYNRDPYPQQSIQSYPEDGGYAPEALYNKYDVAQNEILGSGNFEVIQGGTFYDDDTYYHANSNRKPYNNNKGNFLENFRDFADIKGEYEYNKK